MAESSLSIARSDLNSALGRNQGWSRSTGDWDATQTADANAIIESGERRFYGAYDWSFKKITMRLHLVNDKADYDLPDDFGHFTDTCLYFSRDDNKYCPVKLTGVSEVLRARQSPITTSLQPEIAAETWLPADGSKGQRKGLMLWPTPSESGVLNGQYEFLPGGVTSSLVYPLGGEPASETLLACVLAQAELHLDGVSGGAWEQRYQELLARSIDCDRKANSTKCFGNLGGRPDRRFSMRPSAHYVSYAGNFYNG